MKKLLFSLVAMTLLSLNSYAYKVIIDVNGSGSVTIQNNGTSTVITFDCKESPDCCGSYEVELPSQLPIWPPSIGDNVTVKECLGTRTNVIHQWSGKFIRLEHDNETPNKLTSTTYQTIQDF
jgi:hypothetical protein